MARHAHRPAIGTVTAAVRARFNSSSLDGLLDLARHVKGTANRRAAPLVSTSPLDRVHWRGAQGRALRMTVPQSTVRAAAVLIASFRQP